MPEEVVFSPDGGEWDEWRDGWLLPATEQVLSCFREGDRAATVEAVDDFMEGSTLCGNDMCIIFDFLFDVAEGNVECDEEFRNRVIAFRNLYRG